MKRHAFAMKTNPWAYISSPIRTDTGQKFCRQNNNRKKENKMNAKLHVMDHPLIQHKISMLRDKNTSVNDFRELS